MPLKFYHSFDIKEKDFKELFCADCRRTGNSVDMLNFCIGCDSVFCYKCLQDHTRSEESFQLSITENVIPSVYKQASESAGSNNNNRYSRNNNYHSKTDHYNHKLTETRNKLLSLKHQLHKCTEHDRADSERRLSKIMEDMDRKITELKTKVLKSLEDLQRNSSEEIQRFHHRVEEFYSNKEKSIQIILAKMDATLKHLQKATSKTNIEELTAFAEDTVTEAKNLIADSDNHHAEMLNREIKAEIRNANDIFEQSMEDFLCKINALGKGYMEENNFKGSHKPVCKFYDVEAPADTTECDINGSCFMPDGTIMLSDWNNTNIKHLNRENQVTDTCDLPGIPWAVCCSGGDEVAVSLHFLQRIQFVSLKGENMILTDSIKVKHKCRGVAWAGNKIFVSSGGGGCLEGRAQIQVYTREGTLLETYKTDSTGNDLFSCPQHITINTDMSKLYVADKNLGHKTLDMQKKKPIGPYVSAQSNETPAETKGICVIEESNILTCDFILNKVVLHSDTDDSAQSVKTILDRKVDIRSPQSLCYNRNNSTLVVTSGNTNLIQVFKMEIN